MNQRETEILRFLFTQKGFQVERQEAFQNKELQAWKEEFEADGYLALYHLGAKERPQGFDAAGNYLYHLADTFFRTLTDQPDLELTRANTKVRMTEELLQRLKDAVPFTLGAEYVTDKWLENMFQKLEEIFCREIREYDRTVAMYLAEKSQHLRVPERIFFHLVESKEEDYPFAFLATYASKDQNGRVHHVPLQYALTEYKNDRGKLLELLACLNRAAEVSGLISEFVEKGEMFHPLRLTLEEAWQILKDVPKIEETGILCRIPTWWRKRAEGLSVSVNLGEDKPSMLGFDTLLTMKPSLCVNGVPLTREEIEELLAQTEGLAFLKGRWVEVDHQKLQKMLEQIEELGKESENMTLMQAFRMGLGTDREAVNPDVGAVVTNGKWLAGLLGNLRKPASIRSAVVPKSFRANLRPYQKEGFTWLNYMNQLHFGACLADDMGLGKTVQVLAFLEKMRTGNKKAKALLVVPASLLENWRKEAAKFAPEMPVQILHGRSAALLGRDVGVPGVFLTITTYGMASRIKELEEMKWDCLILDEAQAIKNPTTKQTRQIKKLKSAMKIAMTGTPIENDLTNLWSLFDFLDKGLLGSSKEFHDYCKRLEEQPEGYAKLKAMVSPFMLRRVKTDKKIISDLPDKLEKIDYVNMSKKQVVLYRKVVADLEKKLMEADGMERRGLVLASIMKLKQICNHPDQYLGQKEYYPEESGKFERLREICEMIYEKRERVLVFTQFKEITPFLDTFLAEIFHSRGYVLHGGTPVAHRGEIVEAFQDERYVPYIVLSVKAGGTGLNLTNANHVIHFDRWWNPAVENQATDRAYRIGQKKNVLVHKLVSQGTIEEKIDMLLNSKKELAENVIGSGGESWITEMSNEELMSILRLE